ncbi:hypothetical protein BRYFOR_07523 [Marvinbryantia formatexigens DSM 14469]|uniref:Uncharacterized protein n=1 Tax=Marvinbryantia formatexigens DSM 14469 TaxID=478749 RepID=C6LFW3_9FIRM|nr:hypothetical protein [Marvinbryantia formatexigens]EET60327.1 hypothetical protein BRYFOR_07523 [Marvinbryantia formatexigens DSM 14469]UWO25333.1 glutathione peroxidase [Marvinbryantia formatexigens DSM 14469]SDG99710.1 hypothetical protein SAMN05660368_03657 [Marvinbryantia formatexigens]
MNRNRKGVMPEITREIYKSVKKFDRQQFQSFCRDLYSYGFEDGRASVPGIDLTAIYEAIGATKGIGPKKLEEIKRSIEAAFTEKGAQKE